VLKITALLKVCILCYKAAIAETILLWGRQSNRSADVREHWNSETGHTACTQSGSSQLNQSHSLNEHSLAPAPPWDIYRLGTTQVD